MKNRPWLLPLLGLSLAVGAWSLDARAGAASPSPPAKAKKAVPAAEATPTAAITPLPAPPQVPRLSLGVGYPDLRLRARIYRGFDGEFKFAFDGQAQAYSARIYGTWLRWQDFDFNIGGEAGYIKFNGIGNLSGDGMFYEPFVGMRYHINRRFSLSADIGPAFMKLAAGGTAIEGISTIVTTAIYFHLF